MERYVNNHTHITSPNPEKVLDFYTIVMGGKLQGETLLGGNHKAWDVNLGGLIIRISDWTNADESLKREYSEAKGKQQFGVHHLALTVDDLTKACSELMLNGAKFVLPPKDTGPASRVAFIIAPDNVLIELIERKSQQ